MIATLLVFFGISGTAIAAVTYVRKKMGKK